MFRRNLPFDDMFDAFRDLEMPFQRLLAGVRALPGETRSTRLLPTTGLLEEFEPPVECFTRDKQVVLRMELPGIEPADVQVTTLGDRLVVKGEKKEHKEIKEADVHFREIRHGQFERSFALPNGVKPEQVKAFFRNGVLEVSLPEVAVGETHKVPVEVLETGKKFKAA
jgi:HSP20 family protein